ncbi:hypothetical protein EJB05_53805, partial [Eragrostis curvula]
MDGVLEPSSSSASGGALVFLGTIPGSLVDVMKRKTRVSDIEAEIIVGFMMIAWDDNIYDKGGLKRYAVTCNVIMLDTDHNCCEDHYHHCCSMHMLLTCGALLRVVELGFHLVAEDDGWTDDEEREPPGLGVQLRQRLIVLCLHGHLVVLSSLLLHEALVLPRVMT